MAILKKIVNFARLKSPYLLHFDCTGCNGCTIETLACITPRYDVERFGIVEKGNPRHSDILVVNGSVNKKMEPRLKRIYEGMAHPKAVVAVGACAISKGIFFDAYNNGKPIDKIVPVDIYVPGCPPKPEAIIDGIVKALGLWKERLEGLK